MFYFTFISDDSVQLFLDAVEPLYDGLLLGGNELGVVREDANDDQKGTKGCDDDGEGKTT